MTTLEEQTRQPGRSAEKREAVHDHDSAFAARGRSINVGPTERLLSTAAGGLIAWRGVRRGGLRGALMLLLGGEMIQRGATGYCPGYRALGIDTARSGPIRPEEYFERGIQALQSYTISKPPEELYRFWRNFENLPGFMTHLQSVKVIDDRRSHWVARGPAGSTVEWDAEIVNDEPNHLIAWQSLEGADVDNAGSVRFLPAPGNRGTEVYVNIQYIPPAGKLGAAVAYLFGENPRQQIQEDLRHFKQIMEAGEVPTTEGQPHGSCAGRA